MNFFGYAEQFLCRWVKVAPLGTALGHEGRGVAQIEANLAFAHKAFGDLNVGKDAKAIAQLGLAFVFDEVGADDPKAKGVIFSFNERLPVGPGNVLYPLEVLDIVDMLEFVQMRFGYFNLLFKGCHLFLL